MITNFHSKKMPKEKALRYYGKEKVLYLNTFRRMQICTRKNKNGEPYWWRFSGSDSDSYDETESDIDINEYDK